MTQEKKKALLIIVISLILHAISWNLIKETYGWKINQSPEGIGVLISTIGYFVWIYGFIKYARAKSRSELLALLLSFFWIPGLLILLLLTDHNKNK